MASGTRIKQTCLLSWEAGSRLAVRIKHGNTRQGLKHSELSLPDELSPRSHCPACCSSLLLYPLSLSTGELHADLIFAAYAHKTGTAPTAPEDADIPGYLGDASAAPLKLGHENACTAQEKRKKHIARSWDTACALGSSFRTAMEGWHCKPRCCPSVCSLRSQTHSFLSR